MKAHAWEYGFVLSYPKGKTGVTCYSFEPWHFRYFGARARERDPCLRSTHSRIPLGELHDDRGPATHRQAGGHVPAEPPAVARSRRDTRRSRSAPSPTAAAPTASPQGTAAPALSTAAPTALASPAVGSVRATGDAEPTLLAGAGVAIGTMVLGGAWLALRRRRYDLRGPG